MIRERRTQRAQQLPRPLRIESKDKAPVHDAGFGTRNSVRVSQHEVANTGNEGSDVRVDGKGRGGAGEGGARGLDRRGSASGAVGLEAAGGVGGHVAGGDGRGHVCDAAGRRARHGDGVDAVDGRGDVHGSIIDLGVGRLGEGAREEREEEDDDLLEGAHLGGVVVVVVVVLVVCCCLKVRPSVCCYGAVAAGAKVQDCRRIEMLRRHNECLRQVSRFVWGVAVCDGCGVYASAVMGRWPSESV